MPVLIVLIVAQSTALICFGAFALIAGESLPATEYLLYAAAAGIAEIAGVAAFYRGLASGVMSVVAPVAALAPIIPVTGGLVMGEQLTALQATGICLAIAGVVMISRERDASGTASGVAGSIGFGLLAALGFGCFFLAMDGASEGSVPWALLTAKLTAVAVIVAALAVTRAPRPAAAELPVLMLIGVLFVAGDSMYATASTLGLVSVVAVLSSLHTVVTIGLARFYLGEQLQPVQRAGVVAAICGGIAITAA